MRHTDEVIPLASAYPLGSAGQTTATRPTLMKAPELSPSRSSVSSRPGNPHSELEQALGAITLQDAGRSAGIGDLRPREYILWKPEWQPNDLKEELTG